MNFPTLLPLCLEKKRGSLVRIAGFQREIGLCGTRRKALHFKCE